MNSDEESEKILSEGKMKLIRMEWIEAEYCFYSVLKRLGWNDSQYQDQDKKENEDGFDWIRIEALTGLAEVEARRCQRFCYDDLIWFRCMFRSLTFYKEALKHLPQKQIKSRRRSVHLSRSYDSPKPHEAAFYNQSESRIQYQIKSIENLTNAALSEKILQNCFISSKGKPVTFDDDWLKQLMLFCTKDKELDSTPTNHDAQNQEKVDEKENFQPIYKRKIDYDRVQEAIMKLVNDVSIDVRRHYSHMTRLVPQKLIQQRLMLEISRRLTPGSRDNLDLMQVLENAIVYEDISEGQKRSGFSNDAVPVDQITVIDYDEDQDNDQTIYLDIGQSQSQENPRMEYQESQTSLYNIKDLTRASSPSCQSKKSHCNRLLQYHQLETSSSGRLSQAKTTSTRRSIFDAGNAMPSKSTRMKNILTIWRANRRQGSVSGTDSSMTNRKLTCNLQTFEEVSPLTEREKVLNWLQGVEEPPNMKIPKSMSGQDVNALNNTQQKRNSLGKIDETDNDIGNAIKPLQIDCTIVLSTKKAADIFIEQERYCEALEVYKFALNTFKSISPGKNHENETVAELLRCIGMTKCSLGQISVGCQLMQESVGLYSQLNDEADTSKVCEIWYQLGGAYLSEELRKDSLFLRTMQLIQRELEKDHKVDLLHSVDEEFGDDSSDASDGSDNYCVCIFEATECYKQATNLFKEASKNGNLPNTELYLKILCELADCHFMLGNLGLAESRYEEALLLFPRVRGSSTIKENSHVLSMLGSLNFILGNFVRAATMFETSHILNQHTIGDSGTIDDTTLQQAWNLAMLGLSCYHLGHFDKTVAWCTRAFSLYTRVLRGALFNADYYNHWFVIENLYSLGTAYATMDFFEKGVYYLNLGRNLINGCEVQDRQDTKQHVKVLRALADAHASLEETDVALKYYEEAVQVSKKLGENNTKTALQNQLLNRMACVNVDAKNFDVAGNNLEQALGYQKDVEASIKSDMAAVLRRLGATSVLACDVDKAIACYKDCIQAYSEMEWLPGTDEEIVKMLCTLATLYHVKSCTMDDENQVELFMTISEGCFQEAIVITENNPLDISVRVESYVDLQYANFLYQQGLFADALHALLPIVFCRHYENDILVYSGIEQAVLPDHLQSDFNDDTMLVEVQVLAYFLAVICYKSVGLISDADDALLLLYKHALRPNSTAFTCNVCAYALMEMQMFYEASEMFFISSLYKQSFCGSSDKSGVNFWICLCLSAYVSICGALTRLHYNIKSKVKRPLIILPDNESQISSVKRQFSSETGSDLAFCSDTGEMIETYEEWTEEFYPEPWMIALIDPSLVQPANNQSISKSTIQAMQATLTSEPFILADSLSPISETKDEDEQIVDETYTEEVYESVICNTNFLETTSPRKTVDEQNRLNDNISKEINGNQTTEIINSSIDELVGDDVIEEMYEEWVTYEEVVDTPVEILAYLNNSAPNRLVASS